MSVVGLEVSKRGIERVTESGWGFLQVDEIAMHATPCVSVTVETYGFVRQSTPICCHKLLYFRLGYARVVAVTRFEFL